MGLAPSLVIVTSRSRQSDLLVARVAPRPADTRAIKIAVMVVGRGFAPCTAPSKFCGRSCNRALCPFQRDLAPTPLHHIPCHPVPNSCRGRHRAQETCSREQFPGEIVLSSTQGIRMRQWVIQDTHPWHLPSSTRNQTTLGGHLAASSQTRPRCAVIGTIRSKAVVHLSSGKGRRSASMAVSRQGPLHGARRSRWGP